MTIETKHGNIELVDPPDIKPLEIPESMKPYCNKWGNIIEKPIKVISENHGPHFIQVFLYAINDYYFYGYQLKIKKLVLQKKANVTDRPEESEGEARQAARNELLDIVKNHSKKALEEFHFFDALVYEQGKLF